MVLPGKGRKEKMKKKQLEIKNRELELQNVRFEAWLKAYDNGEYLVEGVK